MLDEAKGLADRSVGDAANAKSREDASPPSKHRARVLDTHHAQARRGGLARSIVDVETEEVERSVDELGGKRDGELSCCCQR